MSFRKNKKYRETKRCGFIPVLFASCLLTACGGGGGGSSSDSGSGSTTTPPVSQTNVGASAPATPDNNAIVQQCPTTSAYSLAAPPAPTSGVIAGRITYARVPFSTHPGQGLDYNAQSPLPVRGAVVEALKALDDNRCDSTAIATTLSDGDGWYRLNTGTSKVCVRVRAQLYRAADGSSIADWNFAVADNTAGNTFYAMTESIPSSADAQPRRDLHAASGWSGGGYNATRVAAPFAILDTACKTMNAVLEHRAGTPFGALTFMWSVNNTSDSNGTYEQGKIGGAFFDSDLRAIYLRGDAAVDTDEFDPMVIAHEFGHFVLHVLSRSDSIGGDHSLLDTLDPRVAFDEGWATAFAGLALRDPIYRDSDEVATSNSQAREFSFNIRTRYGNTPTGWFSESSVQRALYTLGSSVSDGGTGMGLGTLLQTFAGNYRQTDSLASIFSYGEFLKNEQSGYAGAIAAALSLEQINGHGITAFAENETNAPSLSNVDLPVYARLDDDSSVVACSRSTPTYGEENALSNRRYVRFIPQQSRPYRLTITPQNGGVPGMELIYQGQYLLADRKKTSAPFSMNTGALTAMQSYVVSLFHVGNVDSDSNVPDAENACFKLSVVPL